MSFRDTIAKDDNVGRQFSRIVALPQPEAVFEVLDKRPVLVRNLLDPALVLPGHGRPLGKVAVDTGHQADDAGCIVACPRGKIGGVGDVVSHKHGVSDQFRLVLDLVVDPAKLEVDFQANVGKVPELTLLLYQHRLAHADGREAKLHIPKPLHSVVSGRVLVRKSDQNQVRARLLAGNLFERVPQRFLVSVRALMAARRAWLGTHGDAHVTVQELSKAHDAGFDGR